MNGTTTRRGFLRSALATLAAAGLGVWGWSGRAVRRAIRTIALDRTAEMARSLGTLVRALGSPLSEPARGSSPLRRFVVRGRDSIRMVDVDDVDWIEAVDPGIGFGKHGDDYVRFALTVDRERIAEVGRRLSEIRW